MTTPNLPKTIKSLIQPDIHSPNLVLTEIPLPLPTPGTTEHLIRVQSTSPCSGELTWSASLTQYISISPEYNKYASAPARLQIPCFDLSGTVILAPENSPFPPGTEVYTRTSFARPGNAREYTIARAEELARKPGNLSWEEAAALPLSAFTAWQALFVHGGIRCVYAADAKEENGGRGLLVGAASGGVGVLCVQFARAAGVGWIVGVCSGGNGELVRGLGADEVVDYRKESLGEWARRKGTKVDLVVDMMGGRSLEEAWRVVRAGGRVVSIKEDPGVRRPKEGVEEGVEGKFFVMEPEGWQLEETTRLVEKGLVRAVVDSVWSLEDFQKAFDIVEGGHARGKVIINVRE